MRLAQKIILYALAVALLPLAATGFTLVRLGERALRERIAEHQRAAAVAVAAKVSQAVEEVSRRLATVMELADVATLSVDERAGLARMLYRQSNDISIALLLDSHGGLLAPPALLDAGSAVGTELALHPAASAGQVKRLVANLTLSASAPVQGEAVLLSPVYFPPDEAARVAVAIPCCPQADGAPFAIAAVEIALGPEVLRVEGIDTGEDSSTFVVDPLGRLIAHPSAAVGEDWRDHGAVAAFLRAERSETAVFAGRGGLRMGAFAPVGKLGWGVVVEQSEAVAFAAAERMRQQTLLWLAVTAALAVLSGILFAGRLRGGLSRMMDGARAFGEGRLGRRIEVKSADEIGELAGTMNAMAAKLESSLRELEEWSRTLERKVEERTRELQSTQAQLLTQSKLAAVGQLGAGVAHEVNNPLAGVLGLVQLMLRRRTEADPEYGKLKDIETAAKRCKEVVSRLLRFSERRAVGRTEVRVNELVDEVLGLLEASLTQARIRVRRELAEVPEVLADPGQIAQVFINIVQNARTAMPDGGELTVVSRSTEGGGVQVSIGDTGVGILPEHLPRIFDPFFTTKRVWTDVGLGLSVAHRIVSDHGGRIEVESKVGVGSTFTVNLPREPPPAAEQAASPTERRSVLLE